MARVKMCEENGCHAIIQSKYRWCPKHWEQHHLRYKVWLYKRDSDPIHRRHKQQETEHYDQTVRRKATTKQDANRAKFYRSKQWEQTRNYILNRDVFTCQICGLAKHRLYADHIVPLRLCDEKEMLNVNNLWTLCAKCHNKKTKEEQRKNDSELLKMNKLKWIKELK